MNRIVTFVLGGILGAALGAFAAQILSGGEPATHEQEPTVGESTTPEASPSPTLSEPVIEQLSFGEAGRTQLGNEVTVYGWNTDVDWPIDPDSQKEFSQVDVGFCFLGEVTGGDRGFGGDDVALAVSLKMPDDTRLSPDPNAYRSDDLLGQGTVPPGDCIRGLVVFQSPAGERPEEVLFETTGGLLRWRVA